jgi:predicted alpha-1,2-mannosidase
MQLMGGESVFAARLDSLFSASSHLTGAASGDISGLIGQYAHGNEPSHHIIHLYNYANRPWRTQELVDSVLYSQYHNTPEGLSGNEDCGQMSAWYILNAMGFYQVCPGNPVYSIGRPIFDKVTINLTNGKKFTITCENNSRENKYIQKMELNGQELAEPFFKHEDIMNGGELKFTMGAEPKK